MTWQQVVICLALIGAAVLFAFCNKETLAATAIGAVAGYVTQHIPPTKKPTLTA